MDLFLVNESSTRSASGKVIGIALLGVAALLRMPATTQSSRRRWPPRRRTNRTASSRTPRASRRG